MEQIYPKRETQCRLVKTRTETVKLLLAYSQSLHIREIKGMTVEQSMN
jgi:hypothetical protein